LFERSKSGNDKYILGDGQTTKIAISYEKQANKNTDAVGSKINDNVKIQFQGLYLPIESKNIKVHLNIEITLNKLGNKVHKLTESDVRLIENKYLG